MIQAETRLPSCPPWSSVRTLTGASTRKSSLAGSTCSDVTIVTSMFDLASSGAGSATALGSCGVGEAMTDASMLRLARMQFTGLTNFIRLANDEI